MRYSAAWGSSMIATSGPSSSHPRVRFCLPTSSTRGSGTQHAPSGKPATTARPSRPLRPSLNARTQDKLGRRDLSDTKLMNAVFNSSPKAGTARLILDTAGLAADTASGMQIGVMNYATGCFQAIRNPATHEDGRD